MIRALWALSKLLMRRLGAGIAVSLAVVLVSSGGSVAAAAGQAAAAPRQPDVINETPPQLRAPNVVLQPVPAANVFHVVLRFASAHPVALSAFDAAVSTPGNPLYHHFLSHSQMEKSFGASPEAVRAAQAFLVGEAVDASPGVSNSSLHASMTAAQVLHVFGARMEQAVIGGRDVIGPNRPLTLPPALNSVTYIEGLTTVRVPTPELVKASGVHHVGTPEPTSASAERWFQRLATTRAVSSTPEIHPMSTASSTLGNDYLGWISTPAPLQLVGGTAQFTVQLYDANGSAVGQSGVAIILTQEQVAFWMPTGQPSAAIISYNGASSAAGGPLSIVTNANGQATFSMTDAENESLTLSAGLATPAGQEYGPTSYTVAWAQPTLGLTVQGAAVVPTGQDIRYELTAAGQSGLYAAAFVQSASQSDEYAAGQGPVATTDEQGVFAGYTIGSEPGTGPLVGMAGNGSLTYVTPSASEITAGWSGAPTVMTSTLYPGALGATPQQINAAYDASATASAPTDAEAQIGIYAQSTFTQTDIATFFQAMGLAPPTITVVPVDGNASSLQPESGWHGELELDLERAGSAAPGAHIIVYTLSPSSSTGDPMDVLSEVVGSDAVSVFSMSFTIPEDTLSSGYLSAWTTLEEQGNAEGITFVASSGDSGAYGDPSDPSVPAVGFPASDPNTTAVGGTQAGIDVASSSLQSQYAWSPDGAFNGLASASGGGFSWYFSRPSYQSTMVTNSQRGVPDVAFLATWPWYLTFNSDYISINPFTGASDAGWVGFGGTSGSAPTWAGYLADMAASVGRFGNANEMLYTDSASDPSAFSDVTVGNNGLYQAGIGWDPVTGLGSVRVDALMAALQVPPILNGVSPTSAAGGSVITVDGSGLGASQGGSYVTFIDNGVGWGPPGWQPLTVDSWSPSAVTFTVPSGVTTGTTGTVTVTTGGGTSNAEGIGITAAVPVISALSPSSASAGSTVTVDGTGFGVAEGTSYVTVVDQGTGWGPPGWDALTIDGWSPTAITLTIPAGVTVGTTGTVTVTTDGGTSNPVGLEIVNGVPVIGGVTPASASAGEVVTLMGTGFGADQGSSYVELIDDGTGWGPPGWDPLTVDAWSSASITFTVPAGVTSGTVATVAVATSGGTSSPIGFGIASNAPVINSANPTSVSAGDVVTVAGSGFGASQGSSYVTLVDNGTGWGPPGWDALVVDAWSAGSIAFTVPAGVSVGTTASLTVTTAAGTSNLEELGIVSNAPIISGVSPASGGVGSVITLSGSGFGTRQGTSYVTLIDDGIGWGPPGWDSLTVDSWSPTTISFAVPAGATVSTTATVAVTTAAGISDIRSVRVT